MKIAYDNQIFNMQKYGGISRYIANLAECISKDENEVKIFAGMHQNGYLNKELAVEVLGKKISYPPKGQGKLTSLNNIFMNRAIDRWSPDIIHKTYYFNRKEFDTPSILTVHDMIHEIYSDQFSVKDKTIRIKREAVEQADHIISVSNSTKRDLINLFDINESKITVIYHGINKENAHLDLSKDYRSVFPPFMLYVGQREGYKNFRKLLESYALTKASSEYNIIAFGGGAFSKKEQNLIKKLGLTQKVTQLNGDDSVLRKLYASAIAFVYPSLYEGFGMPILEAMSYNCPVICSNTSSLPEVGGNAVIYFEPNEASSICEAIDIIVSDTERRSNLIKLGQERLNSFSWDKCSVETTEVYKKII